MLVWDFLKDYLPTHWPHDWKGSFQTEDHGTSHPIDTITDSHHDFGGGQPTLQFTFSANGRSHTIKAAVKNVHGDVDITFDDQIKPDHPVLKVGIAFHFPNRTTGIVHFIFSEGDKRQDYRFEGTV